MPNLASYNGVAVVVSGGFLAPAVGATLEVRVKGTGALAAIFSDEAGTVPIVNPSAFADANARFLFFAAGIARGYTVKATLGAATYTLDVVAVGTAAQLDASTLGAALLTAVDEDAANVLLDGPKTGAAGFALEGGYLDWTVAGNVLTVAVKTWAGADPSATDPVYVTFRDVTPATGNLTRRKLIAATSIAINDTALLGTTNNVAFRLWCVAFDDAGTVRLALINCLNGTSIFPLAGFGVASATLEDNASDAAHVFYSSGAAVAAKAFAALGYATWETGLPTAGTWSAAPTRKQLFGPGVPLPGQLIQSQRTATGASATGTTLIPFDDTIPQITEGDQYLSQAIIPTSAANVLDIESALYISSSVPTRLTNALFQDATANALTVATDNEGIATVAAERRLKYRMLAGTSSSTTFRSRGGGAAAGTVTFNGEGGSRQMGGVFNSFLEVCEVMA